MEKKDRLSALLQHFLASGDAGGNVSNLNEEFLRKIRGGYVINQNNDCNNVGCNNETCSNKGCTNDSNSNTSCTNTTCSNSSCVW